MTKIGPYKGYEGSVNQDGNVFSGEVLGIPDVVHYQASSLEELKKEFANSIEDYLKFIEDESPGNNPSNQDMPV